MSEDSDCLEELKVIDPELYEEVMAVLHSTDTITSAVDHIQNSIGNKLPSAETLEFIRQLREQKGVKP